VSALGLTTDIDEVQMFFKSSKLLKDRGLGTDAIEYREGAIELGGVPINSYYASVAADFLRRKALESKRSFSFETVMSAPDKVELLRTAGSLGYRTYLYFVATEHPDINVARVAQRVADGGHDVPTDKIVARYYRSLALLADAIRSVNRAFIFDSSENQSRYVAEVTDGTRLTLKTDEIPTWFQSTMAKL
jgi:predicted ABC-type ATPase